MNIIAEIKKLPNLGYVYTNESNKRYRNVIVVLGGNSCPAVEMYQHGIDIPSILGKIESIYIKGISSHNDKIQIAKHMKRMMSSCEARTRDIYTIEQQTKYIDALSDAQKDEIASLVSMYIDCYAIYLEFAHVL